LCFDMNFMIDFFYFCEECHWNFCWGLHWLCRLLSVVNHFCNIDSANSWTWGDFPSPSVFFNFFLQCSTVFIVEPIYLPCIWQMDFKYLYETELKNLLQLL
jgi:hypothetical protein